jgi:hypothetical protein
MPIADPKAIHEPGTAWLQTIRPEDVVAEAQRIAEAGDPADLPRRRMRLLRRFALRLGDAERERATAHCEGVARTAARLAQLMGRSSDEAEAARLVGLLHGLGALAAGGAEMAALIAGALGADDTVCRAVSQVGALCAGPPLEPAARIVTVAGRLESRRAGGHARTLTDALTDLRRGRGTLYDSDAVVAAHLLGASAMSLAA